MEDLAKQGCPYSCTSRYIHWAGKRHCVSNIESFLTVIVLLTFIFIDAFDDETDNYSTYDGRSVVVAAERLGS